jgi:hypothetical protein
MQLLQKTDRRFEHGISGVIKGVDVHKDRIAQAEKIKLQLQEAFLLPSEKRRLQKIKSHTKFEHLRSDELLS